MRTLIKRNFFSCLLILDVHYSIPIHLSIHDQYILTETNDPSEIKWYADSAFAVHFDGKSHTGSLMTIGNGAISCTS